MLLLVGSVYSSNFLSPEYLLLQFKVASFLGIIATGMMLVILLGHIDLSVPWIVTSGAMMACAAAALGPLGSALAIPFGIACGALIGLVNGWATGYLRIPSMIVTLATNAVAQGLMVVYTGRLRPQDAATPAMRYAATGEFIPKVPNGVIIWLAGGGGHVVPSVAHHIRPLGLCHRQPRSAAYLSGINTRRVILIAFVLSGALSALGGVLLAGYAAKAAQSMGDAYLFPAIAAVVLGGTHVLGGRGTYAWNGCRRAAHHAFAVDPFGHANTRSGKTVCLRRGHSAHAADVRAPGADLAHRASRRNRLRSGRCARFKVLQQLIGGQLTAGCCSAIFGRATSHNPMT